MINKNLIKKLLNEDFKSQNLKFISQTQPNDGWKVNLYISFFKTIRSMFSNNSKDLKHPLNSEVGGLDVKPFERLDIDRYKTFNEFEVFVGFMDKKYNIKEKYYENIYRNFKDKNFDFGSFLGYIENFNKIVKSFWPEKDNGNHFVNGDVMIEVSKGKRLEIENYKTGKDLETFVDFVRGQVEMSQNSGVEMGMEDEFIEIKSDGEIVYDDKDLQIYRADTPRGCIEYKGSFPYSWCISANQGQNAFYTYRLKDFKPTVYFIKNKKKIEDEKKFLNVIKSVGSLSFRDKYHFFVVMVFPNFDVKDLDRECLLVTSAMNDGDQKMNLADLLKIEPLLKDRLGVLKPRPLDEEETKIIDRFKKGLNDKEFDGLSDKDKVLYMDVYFDNKNKTLTDNQYLGLSDELKKRFIGYGLKKTDVIFEDILNDKELLKYYDKVEDKKISQIYKKEYFSPVIEYISKLTNKEIFYLHEKKILNLENINFSNIKYVSSDLVVELILNHHDFFNQTGILGIKLNYDFSKFSKYDIFNLLVKEPKFINPEFFYINYKWDLNKLNNKHMIRDLLINQPELINPKNFGVDYQWALHLLTDDYVYY